MRRARRRASMPSESHSNDTSHPQDQSQLSVESTRPSSWRVVARLVVFPWSLIAQANS